ncbi:chemotaxis response regulator CheY [Candidatus Acidulodesulfobacterium sp. H_13]|uniref:chemotaxis response regulator CheY n=1 Tax=Candidatus Acidulodesulfobacterium sp. H_13 TaxID=3395470 RepID=UPI003AF4AF7C
MAIDLSMKILIVDDFSTMRRIIKNILKQIGFSSIDEAENGEIALSKIIDGDYDFVISDWNMPEMSGIELLKKVRMSETVKDLPFLMVTAESKKENVIEAVKAGVNNYIVKPFTAEVLQEKISKIFPD